MYRKVLIASDPEGLAAQAVPVVASLVRGADTRVRVLAVDVATAIPQVHRDLAVNLNHLVDDLCQEGVHAEGAVETTQRDHVAEAIAADAERWGADLVVLGSHRRGDLRSLLVGSVGHAVARRTRRPLLFVGSERPEDAPRLPPPGGRRVLIAVDYDPSSQHAIEAGIAISGPGSRVHIIHVVTFPRAGSLETIAAPEVVERERETGTTLVEDAVKRFAGHGIDATSELFGPPGPVAHEIVRAADDLDADVIVLGSRRPATAWALVAGSVAHEVIALTHRSVLLAGPQPVSA